MNHPGTQRKRISTTTFRDKNISPWRKDDIWSKGFGISDVIQQRYKKYVYYWGAQKINIRDIMKFDERWGTIGGTKIKY